MKNGGNRMKKSFPTFDCDSHINDPLEIWSDYVEPEYRELVRQTYWRDDKRAWVNGRSRITGGANPDFQKYNVITISGPGVDKKVKRKLLFTDLDDEKLDYLDHKGAYDPHARVKDLDLLGIDQVMVIPTAIVGGFYFAESVEGAYAFSRAYNNWAHAFCSANPERLFAAGWLPLQDPYNTVDEMHRIAKRGTRMSLIRPIDARGNYPNQILAQGTRSHWDMIFRTFEETGMVCGMHTFPSGVSPRDVDKTRMFSPGQLVDKTAHEAGFAQGNNSQTLSFIYEAATWLTQVLLSGFLDRYSKLKMAILESNASWLPGVLEQLDRQFVLYANERTARAKRLPSEAFYDQCYISFEGDEDVAFRQWDRFEDVGIWSSDVYHHDGSDAWSALREMEESEVPHEVQAKLMGGNAVRMYGIEPKVFVSEEQPLPARPDWFPKPDEVEEFAKIQMAASQQARK